MTRHIRKASVVVDVPNPEGNTVALYDGANCEELRRVRAWPVLIGRERFAGTIDATLRKWLERGPLVTYLLDGGAVAVRAEIAVGPPLTEAEVGKVRKARSEVTSRHQVLLSLPSGQLCLETFWTVRIADEPPQRRGAVTRVPPGDYVLTVHYLDRYRRDFPTEVLTLTPVGQVARGTLRTLVPERWEMRLVAAFSRDMMDPSPEARPVEPTAPPASKRLPGPGEFEMTRLPSDRRVQKFDAELARLGIQPFADLQIGLVPAVVRAYTDSEKKAWVGLIWPWAGRPVLDFYTRFDDGSSLTTTSSRLESSALWAVPEAGTIVADARASVAQLWKRHLSGIAKAAKRGARPRLVDRDPAAMVAAYMEALRRGLEASNARAQRAARRR